MRPIATGLAVLAASTVLTATASTTASAATAARQDCPDNAVCFWTGPYFTGQRSVRQNPAPPSVCANIPGQYARSVVNHTGYTRIMYHDPNCAPPSQVDEIGPGEEREDIEPPAQSWR
ncbi:peptidase inhibitor family I36 protein [Actinomadura sp. 3N508]|uniref:peptidase inhibitor family I36 protein n=1 Tax=Actinomadura sp. 3N508 TaxID=3375153 RepID=UPI0037984C24